MHQVGEAIFFLSFVCVLWTQHPPLAGSPSTSSFLSLFFPFLFFMTLFCAFSPSGDAFLWMSDCGMWTDLTGLWTISFPPTARPLLLVGVSSHAQWRMREPKPSHKYL
ncbi:hypothetical protein BDP55DRAFT_662630 [Colletotrichum godetiae]|uniref:Secreted protein n=1 Tax=Colletotrichum godetiae TaxID=1209918 RepID=A0AAJ0AL50_9PEZI|nr:uncharacterized protein BDP55DRAFT_662630 [Colletotrichum godetiae]KAK1675897.1 hypothetical protein BDP55DRAFT_662630 [Colletotrichum godetiae]